MHRRDFLAAAAAATVTLSGVAGTREARAQSAGTPTSVRPSGAAQVSLASFDQRVKPLVAAMNLDEKLGQMAQGELNNLANEADVERLGLGSVLSGGDGDPAEGNSLEAWTGTVDRLIERSRRTRLGIPILYGVDAVHGHNNVLGAVIFPHNIGLGCTRNAQLVEEVARITALETRATGIHWTFAPCVAVPRDIRWGRTYEGFAENPALAGELGAAAVRGLQTANLGAPDAVLACAKHYVGDGGTSYAPPGGDSSGPRRTLLDQGDVRVDEETLRRVHLAPYRDAIDAGVGSIMASYSSWNGLKTTGDRHLLTAVLKDELGFEGFVVSDYYAISQVDRDPKTAVMLSINAGIDMAMEPARYETFIGHLKALVEEGQVPESRIDDAVTRILRVKAAMGLLDADRRQTADRSLHAQFGSPEHRAVGRRAVRESLVLLKNEGVLPIARTARRIHVAGTGANDLGMQCGGWTIRWQGEMGDVTPGGTTLLAALEQAVGRGAVGGATGGAVGGAASGAAEAGARVTYSADGQGAAGADLAVVVVGERPYAEGVGDRSDLALSDEDRALVGRVADTGVPTVVVVYSGRPLILGDTLDRAAAVVAAWLPGTEAQGIADVLLGDFAPTGKLSFGWPASMAQVPHGTGGTPLFPYGFGLTY